MTKGYLHPFLQRYPANDIAEFKLEGLDLIDHELGIRNTVPGFAHFNLILSKYNRLLGWEELRISMIKYYKIAPTIHVGGEQVCKISSIARYCTDVLPMVRMSSIVRASIEEDTLLIGSFMETNNRSILAQCAEIQRHHTGERLSPTAEKHYYDLIVLAQESLAHRLVIMASSPSAATTIAAMVRMSI